MDLNFPINLTQSGVNFTCPTCKNGSVQRHGESFNKTCVCPTCRRIHVPINMPQRTQAEAPPNPTYWITGTIPQPHLPTLRNISRILRVNSIPWGITQDNLRSLFQCYGEIENMRIIRELSGMYLDYAFVQFQADGVVEQALQSVYGIYSYFTPSKTCSKECTEHFRLTAYDDSNLPLIPLAIGPAQGCRCEEYMQDHWQLQLGGEGDIPPHPKEQAMYVPEGTPASVVPRQPAPIDKCTLLLKRPVTRRRSRKKYLTSKEIEEDLYPFQRVIHRIEVPKYGTGQSFGSGYVYLNTADAAEQARQYIDALGKYWVGFARY